MGRGAKIILDPIHGHVEVPGYCMEVIDTPEFQRLRSLKQLGLVYLVFPSGVHTRFEHSIGVSTLARKFIRRLRHKQPELDISVRDIRCITLAALCHDLGHGPFSHFFETWLEHRGLCFSHEGASIEVLRRLVDSNALDWPAEDIAFVSDLISGRPAAPAAAAIEERAWIYNIVANPRTLVDVDKWDYIARDVAALGLKERSDFSRLARLNRVVNGEICFAAKSAFTIAALFQARYGLFRQVYMHHAVNGIEHMLIDAFNLADPYLKIADCAFDPERLVQLNDSVLDRIEWGRDPRLGPAQDIIRRIRKRDLYTMVCERTLGDDGDQRIRDAIAGAGLQDVAVVSHHDFGGVASQFPLQYVKCYEGREMRTLTRADADFAGDGARVPLAKTVVRVYCKEQGAKERLNAALGARGCCRHHHS